jgi:asparagine synthase (glutamine-hydrolysing)
MKSRLFRDGMPGQDGEPCCEPIRMWHADTTRMDPLNRMLYVDARTSLPDNLLLYGDKMSMAVSLEARVPYLDLELMSFAESIPAQMKIKGLTQKYALKKALSRWVPQETIERKKIGFATPVDLWLQGTLAEELRDRVGAANSLSRTFFRPKAIDTLIDQHVSKSEDNKRILFALLTLEIWNEAYINGYSRSPREATAVL